MPNLVIDFSTRTSRGLMPNSDLSDGFFYSHLMRLVAEVNLVTDLRGLMPTSDHSD